MLLMSLGSSVESGVDVGAEKSSGTDDMFLRAWTFPVVIVVGIVVVVGRCLGVLNPARVPVVRGRSILVLEVVMPASLWTVRVTTIVPVDMG